MADKTGIAWTSATWNPVVGCSIVSPGCKRCYAMKEAARLERMGGKVGEKYAGLTEVVNGRTVWNGVVRLHEPSLDQPLRWKRPRMIFVNSMSDLWHEALPDAAIDGVLATMGHASWHIYQTLTKRAGRKAQYLLELGRGRRIELGGDVGMRLGGPMPHLWAGFSAENQSTFDERWAEMRALAAAGWLVWCSVEPMLGPIDIGRAGAEGLAWVVIGGESGIDARVFDLDWARDLIRQCMAAGIAVFVKQMGSNPVGFRFRHRKGGDMDEWPSDLRIRTYPRPLKVAA